MTSRIAFPCWEGPRVPEGVRAFVCSRLIEKLLCKLVKSGCSCCNSTVNWALSKLRDIAMWLEAKETSGGFCSRLAYGLLRRLASKVAQACERKAVGFTRLTRWIEDLLVKPEVSYLTSSAISCISSSTHLAVYPSLLSDI